MKLERTGKCMGGPYHGQEWTYLFEEMPVEQQLGNPVQGQSWRINGHYKHDGRGLWTWFGPCVENISPC